MNAPMIDTQLIREALNERAEDLFRLVFGEPEKTGGHEWRAKTSSAQAMQMRGPKRGLWSDHKASEGGDLLDLVAVHFCGLSKARQNFPKVKQEAAQFCGIDTTATVDLAALKERQARREAEQAKAERAEQRRKANAVAAVQQAAQPVTGSPAALYLANRGITTLPPHGLAYASAVQAPGIKSGSRPALVVWGTDNEGNRRGGQRILIGLDGSPAPDETRKPAFGEISGFPARFPAQAEGGPLCVAEGPESALSIWAATGFETWAVFGASGFHAAPLPADRQIILCPDQDARVGTYPEGSDLARDKEAADRAFCHAVTHHLASNRNIWIARAPEPEGSKNDLNDTLQKSGLQAVADAVNAAIRAAPGDYTPPSGPKTIGSTSVRLGKPRYQAPRGGIDEARVSIRKGFTDWEQNVAGYVPAVEGEVAEPAPAIGMRVTTGAGKSYAARKAALSAIRNRAEGDMRPVVIGIPRHRLGEEFKDELEGNGVRVEVYRGRSQPDPEAMGETMCRRSDEAKEVETAGGDVGRTLCKSGEAVCPFYDVCGTRRQQKTQADIWIVPHALFWRKPPSCIGNPAGLIVDEDPSAGLFSGFDGQPYALSLDEVAMPMAGIGNAENADFLKAANAIATAARSTDGRINPGSLDLTTGDLGAALKIAYKSIVLPECGPLSTAKEVRAAVAKVAAQNRRATRLARLFGMVRDALEKGLEIVPGLHVEDRNGSEGETFKILRMKWVQQIAPGWNVPTICASATARDETMRFIWPQMGNVIEAEAGMPFVNIRQITDRAFGKSSLVERPEAADELNRAARRRINRLRRYIETRVHRFPGKALVIAQEAVVEALGTLPPNVATVHFNALSGLDGFKDVRLIIIIGRTQPSPQAVEDRAELIADAEIDRIAPGGWYDKDPAALTMRNGPTGPEVFTGAGKGQAVKYGTDRHPNDLAETIRWGICEGELLQAVGRGRGVNRDDATPLQIDLLTNIPLPLPIDEANTFSAFEPTAADVMAARGVIVENTTAKGAWDAVASILPDLYPTKDAARKANERSRGHILINNISIRFRPRERWGSAKAKAEGARYAVSVRVRADSASEAETVLARAGLHLVKDSFEPTTLSPAPRAPAEAPEHHDDAQDDTAAQATDGRVVALNTRTTPSEPTPRQAATAGGISFWIESPGEPPG